MYRNEAQGMHARRRIGVVLACVLLAGLAQAGEQERTGITVFAAASLAESLQELAAVYQKQTGIPVRVSLASSGTLARQIGAGVQADVFISAGVDWMDDLERRHLIVPGTRRNLVTNRLVLIAPAGSPLTLKLGPNTPIVAALKDGRLAVADPDSVPAGRYTKAALTTLGVWKDLEPRLVRTKDVRAALNLVAHGEAPLGVVYATDSRTDSGVRVLDTFPESSHPPIVYPMALVSGASRAASALMSFLESAAAVPVFAKAGFRPP